MSEVIYQARGRVLHQISKHRELSGSKKRGGAEFFVFPFSLFFLNQLRGVWKSDEKFFEVFDIASQSINNSWRNSR